MFDLPSSGSLSPVASANSVQKVLPRVQVLGEAQRQGLRVQAAEAGVLAVLVDEEQVPVRTAASLVAELEDDVPLLAEQVLLIQLGEAGVEAGAGRRTAR